MSLILDGTNGITNASWTTAGRPASPATGQMGYNTTYGGYEVYNGSAWDTITGGPAFSAYQSSAQSAFSANTFTKIQVQTKEFDTNSNFDNTTNYRFTPTVAGYYLVIGCFSMNSSAERMVSIYKNGTTFKQGTDLNGGYSPLISTLIYLNGSTDYVELYGWTSASGTPNVGQTVTYFQASMVRSA